MDILNKNKNVANIKKLMTEDTIQYKNVAN